MKFAAKRHLKNIYLRSLKAGVFHQSKAFPACHAFSVMCIFCHIKFKKQSNQGTGEEMFITKLIKGTRACLKRGHDVKCNLYLVKSGVQ